MLKRRLLLLRPADLPRLPADSRRLCHPAFPPPVAQRRKGSGYRVNESLPELVPFNQRVHQVLTDAPPKPPGFTAFFSPEWRFLDFMGTGKITCPLPFRPLNRSLGSHPCVALSRPVQVGSVSTMPFAGSTKMQRTAITPLTSCLTFGVHRSPSKKSAPSLLACTVVIKRALTQTKGVKALDLNVEKRTAQSFTTTPRSQKLRSGRRSKSQASRLSRVRSN